MKKRTKPNVPYAVELQMKRRAEILAEAERRAVTALKCATVALNDTEGVGFVRLARFGLHLREIINEYYDDVELGEMRLNRRCEQMGFKISPEGGLMIGYDDEGNPIKLETVPDETE